MAISERQRSVPGLIADLFSEGSTLFRTEMLLARTELSEKVTQGVAGIGLMIGGAVFLIGAVNVLLAAIVTCPGRGRDRGALGFASSSPLQPG